MSSPSLTLKPTVYYKAIESWTKREASASELPRPDYRCFGIREESAEQE
jgi:hypothetical protein